MIRIFSKFDALNEWSHSAIFQSIVIRHGTKTRRLETRLKINASQTIPRSNNLYMVSTNGEVKKKKTIWKNNRRGERIVPNIANDKWKAIGRTQARTRDNTAIPSSRKGNNEQKARLLQGFISYPQPTSRTRWSILEKSDNKRLAGYKLFNCSILAQGISRRWAHTSPHTIYCLALPQGYWGFFVNRFLSVRRNFFSFFLAWNRENFNFFLFSL